MQLNYVAIIRKSNKEVLENDSVTVKRFLKNLFDHLLPRSQQDLMSNPTLLGFLIYSFLINLTV